MKKIFNAIRLVIIVILLWIISVIDSCAKEYRLDIDVVYPGSIAAAHAYDPDGKAVEHNGGRGLQIGIGGTLDISLIYIELINSYGDPGLVYGIEPAKADFTLGPLRAEIAAWIVNIWGYKDKNGTPYTVRAAFPKFELGINPFFMTDINIFINCNWIYLPNVGIKYYSVGYYKKF